MRDLYPNDDPRFVATRQVGEEEGIGRGHDLHDLMESLTGDAHDVYIHEDTDDEMILRATWSPEAAAWEVIEVETQMDLLSQAQELAEQLEHTKLAALAKFCLLKMTETPGGAHGHESLSLGELDSITDEDPELD